MKVVGILCSLVVLVSCSSNDTETVKYSDISSNGKERVEKVDSTDLVKNERPEASAFLRFADTINKDAIWQLWDSTLFLDRFGAKTMEKWIVKNSEVDSLVLLHYAFKDSLLTKNAFFNWLDCFGPNCNSYTVGGNLRVKGKYNYIFVNDQNIYSFESKKSLSPELIRSCILAKKAKKENDNWLFAVVTKPTGKASWKKVVKGKEQEIKNWNEDSK